VQMVIGSIDGYHIVGENSDALEGLLRSYECVLAARQEQGNVPRVDLGDPWRGAHLLEPERYLDKLVRVFVEEILRPPPGARAIGFKEVRYFDHLDRLNDRLELIRRVFEPAVLIFCRRDPVAVAQSAWWKDYPQGEIITEVVRFDAIADAYNARYPSMSAIADYDEYVVDIEKLKPIFAVLGESFDPVQIRRIMDVRLAH
jgi:hypothetical protein